MKPEDHRLILSFESRQDWEDWLSIHPTEPEGVWLKIAKKGAAHPTVNYSDALDAAICYGWIDGQKGALDDQYWLQRFTPRRAKSNWSKVNRERAEVLAHAGRMQPAGLAQVERAKADGRWQAAYESQSRMAVPPDLQAELDRNPAAQAFFDSLNSVNRYAILYRIQTAKKAETRAARIRKFVDMLSNQEKIYP